jgi:NADH-quinone oxidoreductase subunit A
VHLEAYGGLFIYFGLMVLAGVVFILLSHAVQIRVRADKYDWTKPYECGLITEGLKLDRYPVHYYLVGILFVIFDVETIFFVPWAIVGQEFRDSGVGAFWYVEMLIFLLILIVGYLYLLEREVFEWGSKRQHRTGTARRAAAATPRRKEAA